MEPAVEPLVSVRAETADDVKVLLELAAEEEWDYSEYDYLANKTMDPDFLFVAVDSSGKPVGFGGICKVAPDTMYLGSFVVRKHLRRRGIGRKLWTAMMDQAGERNICLDSAHGMVDWYRKQGFLYETFKVNFYTIIITSEMKGSFETLYEILPLKESMWPAVIEYDKQVYPHFNRETILRAWFTRRGTEAVVAVREGSVVGYGSMHYKSENNYGIRNVFADNEAVVEAILRYLFAKLQWGSTVQFMLLDGKPLPPYLKDSVKDDFKVQRMYTRAKIETITERIWLPTAHMV